ncbi:hypothetical protein JX265_007563 [Neoarthrinium moseri]|uniref:Phosphoglycerate mutase family protein n=1 Tax=Neoarthrinium moseri TaxID=1658444 RepID=A0A9P9WJS9_9PEZI|nr:uncharacterized protein JN550_000023 [Neoarthrinium moseri]KAI1866987.1 hypothetical protein JX265_007563 [Neoarthrinium moseri]KAI1877841.1 hypothetical protein JN550_000023 [Neoarthrinium moseri]
MPLEFIYVTRHGFRPAFTVDPASGTYTTAILSPTGVPTDPPLTSYGVEQANELAQRLLKLDPPIGRIYSSPYYRCLQTINPFVAKYNETSETVSNSKAHLAAIRVEKGIGEWFGLAPWNHPASAPLSKLQELFPDIDANYVSQVTPPSHGESLSELHDRVASAMDAIIAQCDKEGIRAIVLSSHAAVVIALGRVLTGRMPEHVEEEDFAAFTCGLSIYRRRNSHSGRQTDTSERQPMAAPDRLADDSAISGITQMSGAGAAAGADMQAAGTSDHPSGCSPGPSWRGGLGVQGGWDCELDSDCSFLKGGPERGWRFSGDESFSAVGRQNLAGSNAGLGVDVEVPKSERRGKHDQPIVDSSKL